MRISDWSSDVCSSDLAGVRVVGQAVYHRHGGVSGQVDDLLVIVGADHDRIDKARENPGGVGDGLPAPKLGGARLHHYGAAAKLTHRHVERNAGAGRVLLEDHRPRVPRKGCVRVGRALGHVKAPLLAAKRSEEHTSELQSLMRISYAVFCLKK